MASPQIEDGYTKIANEIMEALIKHRISGQEYQIVLMVLRKTYGFNKKQDCISMGQFAESTGMNRPLVARIIKKLLHKKILGVTQNGNNSVNCFEFQKDFDKWEVLHKKITCYTKGKHPVPQKVNKSVTQNDTHKRKKETIQKKVKICIPPDFEISERVKDWALKKGFDRIEEHLEAFKRKSGMNDYRYVDWDSAFMEAIREDWAKIRGGNNGQKGFRSGNDETIKYLEDRAAAEGR